MQLTHSNIKEEIAKRYTLRYTLNQFREKVSEYLWMVTAIALGFFTVFYFGGHVLAQCIVTNQ